MTSATQFEFPPAKANYLFNHTTEAGVGGDKRKFWRQVMGFDRPEAIREAILGAVSLEILQKQDRSEYGDRYRAYVKIRDASGELRQIRTVWIVLRGEDVARFVTAVPDSLGD
ncbi:MAG: hypothetical protein IM550_00430 [Microcystis sp. M54BS1]|jgi:hypothetical protein|uniref:DUF6883 domain-containing protein n=1 Tax=Microcystis TaxID=1125 RepID=UPI00188283B1|nr:MULTISPECIES: DUF6883 domain-containing protein [Microcystis]MBE5230049.1 hypothetical protein [Microcystis aeruginosa PMC 728.11]MCA2537753.1 hypothetical protein [Microcystis sp. M54BS1]MCA2594494.1 hypothetical protein [Microcystis sp. M38BS1]MCA2612246.1 hypothetical protein [Microcystis sp. M27BS1]MBE8996403.1 hypothetical protein [Microcystis aeruginosa LEGE 91341]